MLHRRRLVCFMRYGYASLADAWWLSHRLARRLGVKLSLGLGLRIQSIYHSRGVHFRLLRQLFTNGLFLQSCSHSIERGFLADFTSGQHLIQGFLRNTYPCLDATDPGMRGLLPNWSQRTHGTLRVLQRLYVIGSIQVKSISRLTVQRQTGFLLSN